MIHKYEGYSPKISEDVFVATGAQIVGDVLIKNGASIWFNAVLRGDLEKVSIGQKTNIQDGCICHVDKDEPLIIADYVTVGHGAILHGCTVEKGALIGMGATVLNGAKIGENSIVAAGALVPEGKEIPPRSLVVGVPGKVIKELSEEEVKKLIDSAENYYKKAQKYLVKE
ncbi:gamma carbonic anhydrase family protein [Natranaerobius trueperi]|uniref:Gamma carbonic anhydrase family protein n=1 Tax=Natranaerobius trueperi TaxID=759412 RepID=A0A226BWE5_9FIRM|nr:gamma carbonic anhydrase family protein [Natranaerobius trueperi]OWZ83285.1 gamma carbonic anhydrase family protein [Natranaerobius trueperi]